MHAINLSGEWLGGLDGLEVSWPKCVCVCVCVHGAVEVWLRLLSGLVAHVYLLCCWEDVDGMVTGGCREAVERLLGGCCGAPGRKMLGGLWGLISCGIYKLGGCCGSGMPLAPRPDGLEAQVAWRHGALGLCAVIER